MVLVSGEETLVPTSFAVLFADVAGSTRLYDTVGDSLAMSAIGNCLEIFRERTEATGGRVIKTIGDEVMSAFASADAAARAALQIQLRVDTLEPVSGNKLGVRIGFHYGPAVERGDDLFGDTVNLASRLADVASRARSSCRRTPPSAWPRDCALPAGRSTRSRSRARTMTSRSAS